MAGGCRQALERRGVRYDISIALKLIAIVANVAIAVWFSEKPERCSCSCPPHSLVLRSLVVYH